MKPTLRIRQMQENAEALFRYYDLFVPQAILHLVDRTIFVESELFMIDFLKIAQDEREMFNSTIHRFKRWDFVSNHGLSAIEGWREYEPMESMQIIRHDYGVLEVDFNRFNPDFGLALSFGHLFEILRPGKTDSFAVAKGLRKRGIPVPDVRKT